MSFEFTPTHINEMVIRTPLRIPHNYFFAYGVSSKSRRFLGSNQIRNFTKGTLFYNKLKTPTISSVNTPLKLIATPINACYQKADHIVKDLFRNSNFHLITTNSNQPSVFESNEQQRRPHTSADKAKKTINAWMIHQYKAKEKDKCRISPQSQRLLYNRFMENKTGLVPNFQPILKGANSYGKLRKDASRVKSLSLKLSASKLKTLKSHLSIVPDTVQLSNLCTDSNAY